jgi:hypothetical protein
MQGQSLAQIIYQQESVAGQGMFSMKAAKILAIVIAVVVGVVLAGLLILPLVGSLLAKWTATSPETLARLRASTGEVASASATATVASAPAGTGL